MRIEQRIGRLSRIGQTSDIHVFNLVAAGTVEEAVLHLLEAKLNLFELVIGEIDMILGNLEEEREFEDVVADLWAESADMGDFRRRMEELGDRLLAAKEEYLQQQPRQQDLRRPLYSGSVSGVVSWTARLQTRPSGLRRWRRSCATTWTRPAASGTRSSRRSTTCCCRRGRNADGPGRRLGVVRLTFDPEALPEHPSAQLASFGTPLIDRLLDDAVQRGRSGQFYLVGLNLQPHDLPTRLRRSLHVAPATLQVGRVRALHFPQAVFWFQAAFVSDQKEQIVLPVAVDLHYGREVRHLDALLDRPGWRNIRPSRCRRPRRRA